MIVNVGKERTQLAKPVLTPIGPIDSVWTITLHVGDAHRLGTGVVRCHQANQADRIVAAAANLHRDYQLTDRAIDSETWGWWKDIWPIVAGAADSAQLRALSGIDAALWDLAAPPRLNPCGFDARIYWSGFWLGETVDDARREAAASAALSYDAVKMRCDSTDLKSSIARFTAIAEELPAEMPIALELFGTGSVAYVTDLIDGIDATRVLWVEDPVSTDEPETTAHLATTLSVPIAGGEDRCGVDVLNHYVAAAGVSIPIFDFGCCGGPSALARFVTTVDERFETIAVHLDATLAAKTLTHLDGEHRVYLEVLDWWEHATPATLRETLVSAQ